MFDDADDSDTFELTVVMVDGSQVIIDVRLSDTIEDVKINLIEEFNRTSYEQMNLDPAQLTLLHGHIQLEDDSTVAECGLGMESMIVTDVKYPDGTGTIDYTISGKFPKGTSADWGPPSEIESLTLGTSGEIEFRRLGHRRLKSCRICRFKDDDVKWIVIKPKVSEHDMFFRIFLPDEGFYECSITGLRWEIKKAITIDYKCCSWNEYAPIIVIKQSEFSGPLFNIVAEANIVTAIHLPHFICLKGTLFYVVSCL
ncbi:uncharacterized protein [Scyliorhinus torazame]|uniref:uncharacterized protein n=1 Tax=Scyliorhinus torazame TaxID=75743 RepID=UPI003B5BCC89